MLDVITIGSATWDNFLKADYPVRDWKEAPSGKAIVYNLGEKYSVKDYYGTIGGNSANASVTFARQGLKTACVAKIGKDLVGYQFEAHLKREGVKKNLLAKTEEKPTAYSVLLLMESGERTILSYHGASDTFTISDLRISKLRSKWWYLSLAGESYKMFDALLDFAKENKIKVGFNPSGYHLSHGKEGILRRLKDLAFLVLNEEEAAELTGVPFQKEKEIFKKLDDLMPGIVAVTNGPKGVTVSDGKNIYRAGIFKEKRIADRTGAGDSFGSGFVAGLMRALNQLPLNNAEKKRRITQNIPRSSAYGQRESALSPEAIEYAIRLASANATSVVERIGATEGALTREQFEKDPRWQNLEIKIEPA